jgi:hypothetical protein
MQDVGIQPFEICYGLSFGIGRVLHRVLDQQSENFFLCRERGHVLVAKECRILSESEQIRCVRRRSVIAAMRQIAKLVGRILVYSCSDDKAFFERCQPMLINLFLIHLRE